MIDKAEIEQYLLAAKDWVPLQELCSVFGIEDDRDLRAHGKKPGPLSRIAVFSSDGVKHLARATKLEKIKCRNRIKRELISRVRRLKWMEQGESSLHEIHFPHEYEKSTGQRIMI